MKLSKFFELYGGESEISDPAILSLANQLKGDLEHAENIPSMCASFQLF